VGAISGYRDIDEAVRDIRIAGLRFYFSSSYFYIIGMKRIAFFDAKPYDQIFFDAANRNHEFEIKYFAARLNEDSVSLAAGFDAVCAFVN